MLPCMNISALSHNLRTKRGSVAVSSQFLYVRGSPRSVFKRRVSVWLSICVSPTLLAVFVWTVTSITIDWVAETTNTHFSQFQGLEIQDQGSAQSGSGEDPCSGSKQPISYILTCQKESDLAAKSAPIKSLVTFMRAPFSWPSHPPKKIPWSLIKFKGTQILSPLLSQILFLLILLTSTPISPI